MRKLFGLPILLIPRFAGPPRPAPVKPISHSKKEGWGNGLLGYSARKAW